MAFCEFGGWSDIIGELFDNILSIIFHGGIGMKYVCYLNDVIGAAWSSTMASLLGLAEVCSGATLSGRNFVRYPERKTESAYVWRYFASGPNCENCLPETIGKA